MVKLLTRKEATEQLCIHYHTLYAMAKRNEIETVQIGRQQLYNVEKFLKTKGVKESATRRKVCYCRVSNRKNPSGFNDGLATLDLQSSIYPLINRRLS